MKDGHQPFISVRGLYKSFNGKPVLQGVDFDVGAGETLVVLGGSGEGKSVILRHLNGLVEPDRGEVWVDGRSLKGLDEDQLFDVRKKVGMVFQLGALFDSQTVYGNISYPLREHGALSERQIGERVAELLAMVDLRGTERLYPAELSGGMQKRVALARAIAAQPDILFFDEPTTGLDPIMGAIIDGLIVDCVKRLGSTAVAITHDMASAKRIGDQVAMIHKGRIIWTGPPATLMDSGNPVVDQFTHGRREGPIEMELRR